MQVIGGVHVRQVRVAGQKRQRHVEGVGDVLLGGLQVGQRRQVAHRVRQHIDLQTAFGHQHAAGAAAAETLLPLLLQAVTFLVAHHFGRRQHHAGHAGVVVDAALHRGVVGRQGHLLEAGAQRRQAAGVRVARVGEAEADDLLRRVAHRAGGAAVLVVIDRARAVRLAADADVLARQDPDLLRHAQERVGLQQPVGAAVDLQVELRQLPEVEAVEQRVHRAQQRQQRMVGDFLDALGGLRRQVQVRRGAQAFLDRPQQRLGGALDRPVLGRGDVQPRRVGGADGGIDAGAGPGGVFQFREQFQRPWLAVLAVGVAGDRAPRHRRGDRFAAQPARQAIKERGHGLLLGCRVVPAVWDNERLSSNRAIR